MNKNRLLLSTFVLISSLTIGLPSAYADAAQGKGKGNGNGNGKGKGNGNQAQKHEQKAKPAKAVVVNPPGNGGVIVDRDGHVRLIREYGHAGSLPPGLAKRQVLPPGLREQLRENGTLPPGLQKYWVPVPAPLAVRLPAVPQYHERYFVGDDLIVVNSRTNQVVAVIRNVW